MVDHLLRGCPNLERLYVQAADMQAVSPVHSFVTTKSSLKTLSWNGDCEALWSYLSIIALCSVTHVPRIRGVSIVGVLPIKLIMLIREMLL